MLTLMSLRHQQPRNDTIRAAAAMTFTRLRARNVGRGYGIALCLLLSLPFRLVAQPRAVVARFDREAFSGRAYPNGDFIFHGVPYAAAPTGSLRWRPPQKRVPSARTRQATEFGPSCPQSTGLGIFYRNIAAAFGRADSVRMPPLRTSEDCLTLNIWTRQLDARQPALPVMVWIHGGSNITGDGSAPLYNGGNLVQRGVVVVTINYRLGALGFMAHPSLTAESPDKTSGNYALMDQIAALQWVQRNIAAVGGDPTRVTIFGESAGSIDILHLMASPLARGLFHRVIAQSGAPMSALPTLAQAENVGKEFERALGVDSTTNVLAAMRAKTAAEVLAVSTRVMDMRSTLGAPIADGHVLVESTGKAFDQGRIAKVPLLIGSNALEMSSLRGYLPVFDRTMVNYADWLKRTFSLAAPRLLTLYPAASDADVDQTLVRLTTDLYMTCPSRFAARSVARANASTYLYQFTRVLPGGERLGAFHSAEIGYVFGTKESWLPVEPVDFKLSDTMMQYWTQFAATGTPNRAGLAEWPAHDEASDRYLELGADVVPRSGLQRDACDLVQMVLRAQNR
jgi:para-nitrobenzyl esterase